MGGFTLILRRLLQVPPSLFFITVIIFSLLHIAPGDPIDVMIGSAEITPEVEQELVRFYGLDKPLHLQYIEWLRKVAVGDLGQSIHTREYVATLIAERFPVTMVLTLMAMGGAVLLAIPIGLVAALKRNTFLDYLTMGGAVLGMSIPTFVLGVLFILFFGVMWRLLPISGIVDIYREPGRAIMLMIMPAVSLGLSRCALFARLIRASMLEVLLKDYIRVARAKGLSEMAVVIRHALRNSLIPFITLAAIQFAYLLGGAVVTENIFSIPGLGSLLIHAVNQRDFPVVQGITLVTALIFLASSLVADILYGVLDPRVQERPSFST